MYRHFLIPFAVLFSLSAAAQNSPDSAQMRPPQEGQRPGGPQQLVKGKMYGKIVDNSTGKPIDGASVTILHMRSPQDSATGGVMVGTAFTEANGEFEIENVPVGGRLNLVVTALGYSAYKSAVAFERPAAPGDAANGDPRAAMLVALNKDLGNLRLLKTAGTQQLKEVTITAQTPQFALEGEKKVFNLSQNLNTQGGTVTDALRNMPGVLVDADGNVSVRGNGPQILVDGRQTTLSLDQIPADAVESLELITNPSAKYEAQAGAGGVLNVVLKKNRKQGYNGNVRAGADSRGGANVGGDFNVRSGKFNISLSGNGRRNGGVTYTNTERTDRYSIPNNLAEQKGIWNPGGYHGMGRIGVDYFMTNRTTFSVALTKNAGRFEPEERIDISQRSLDAAQPHDIWARRSVDSRRNFDMTGVSLGMKHLFPQQGREFTFNIDYNQNTNSNNAQFTTDTFATADRQTPVMEVKQMTSGSGKSAFGTVQADYVQPFSNGSKIEAGLRATIREMENANNNYRFNSATNEYQVIPNPVAEYKSLDQVYAAYASYSGNLGKKTSYQIGLRAESSDYLGKLPQMGREFHNTYPVSLFPSVFLSHKLTAKDQLQFSYRRGINRPSFFQLMPFADYTDPLNIRQGNAGLKPEFIHTIEGTYLRNWSRNSYATATAYYRYSTGLISSYQTIQTNPFTGNQAVVSTAANLGTSHRYGLELTSQFQPLKWWTVLANVNGYNAVIHSDSLLAKQANYLSGFAKLNNTFTLPSHFTVQVSGVYQSRTSLLPENSGGGGNGGGGGGGMFGGGSSGTAQGYLDQNWFLDVSVRKAWGPKDAVSLTLACNDVFGTRRFIQHTENAYFIQDYDRLSNPYTFRLNLSWKFGQVDADLFRRKNTKSSGEGGEMF